MIVLQNQRKQKWMSTLWSDPFHWQTVIAMAISLSSSSLQTFLPPFPCFSVLTSWKIPSLAMLSSWLLNKSNLFWSGRRQKSCLLPDQPKVLTFLQPQPTHQEVFLNTGMLDIVYLFLQIIPLTYSTSLCASKHSPQRLYHWGSLAIWLIIRFFQMEGTNKLKGRRKKVRVLITPLSSLPGWGLAIGILLCWRSQILLGRQPSSIAVIHRVPVTTPNSCPLRFVAVTSLKCLSSLFGFP